MTVSYAKSVEFTVRMLKFFFKHITYSPVCSSFNVFDANAMDFSNQFDVNTLPEAIANTFTV